MAFLRGYLRAPGAVGSITPSSLSLARRMARLAGVGQAHAVVELGAGTGAITRALLEALPADGRLWAFEIDAEFARTLRHRYRDPRLVVVERSAEQLRDVMAEAGVEALDAIVSALPFSLLGKELTRRLLDTSAHALRRGAPLVALQYHPWYLPPLLRERFGSVERHLWPWNVPPALLLRVRAP